MVFVPYKISLDNKKVIVSYKCNKCKSVFNVDVSHTRVKENNYTIPDMKCQNIYCYMKQNL